MTAMAIAGGLGAATNLIGSSKANEAAKKAQAAQDAAYARIVAQLEAIGVPSIEAQEIVLNDPQLVGELVPEMLPEVEALQSSMADVGTDPRLKQAQMDALSAIQERTTGLTPQDMIAMRQTKDAIAGQLQSQDANILQNMQQRGLGGSGMELMMRQGSGQSAQRQASEEADRLAAQQYAARMGALEQAGSMAGNLRSQDFGEQSAKASASDAMSKFNLQNKMGITASNIGARNQAQAANLSQKQILEGIRAGNRNQEEMTNKALIDQDYQNRLNKVKILTGAQTEQANAAAKAGATQAANTQGLWSSLGQSITGVGSAIADYYKK